MAIFSFTGYTLTELFRKLGNWRQIYKQKSSSFCTSNIFLKCVQKKKLLGRHNKDISLTPSGLQKRLQMAIIDWLIMSKIKTTSKMPLKFASKINLGRWGARRTLDHGHSPYAPPPQLTQAPHKKAPTKKIANWQNCTPAGASP